MSLNIAGSNDSDKVSLASMLDGPDMLSDDHNKIPTVHLSLQSDNAVLAVANFKTAVRFWDAGTFLNGSPNTGDMIVFTDTMNITSGGNAVFNLTSDHTSTGSALCSSIIADSCVANFVDSSGVYSQGAPSIAGNLKTVTIATTKQVQTGVVVLTITVVGTVTQPVSPNGTTVRFFGIGISV